MAIELVTCHACGTKNASHRTVCLKCSESLSAKEPPNPSIVSQFVERRGEGPQTKEMAICVICNRLLCGETIPLRTGAGVCLACISAKESRIKEIRSQIYSLETLRAPKNIWDWIGAGIIVLFILCVLALGIHFILLLGFFGAWFYALTSQQSKRRNEPFKQSIKARIDELGVEKSSVYSELCAVYEQYWDVPPDWSWRREQVIKRDEGRCCNCGRRMSGSRVPFHVHHVMPKSNRDGNHKLENLELLCEICHSKIDLPGHELVKKARKKRLKKRITRGYRRITSRFRPIA